jgi:hypothetical protein
MQLYDLIFIIALGGLNFCAFQSGRYIKNVNAAIFNSDKERRNNALREIKFRF